MKIIELQIEDDDVAKVLSCYFESRRDYGNYSIVAFVELELNKTITCNVEVVNRKTIIKIK